MGSPVIITQYDVTGCRHEFMQLTKLRGVNTYSVGFFAGRQPNALPKHSLCFIHTSITLERLPTIEFHAKRNLWGNLGSISEISLYVESN